MIRDTIQWIIDSEFGDMVEEVNRDFHEHDEVAKDERYRAVVRATDRIMAAIERGV